jgi:hypothetical protein
MSIVNIIPGGTLIAIIVSGITIGYTLGYIIENIIICQAKNNVITHGANK